MWVKSMKLQYETLAKLRLKATRLHNTGCLMLLEDPAIGDKDIVIRLSQGKIESKQSV